MRADTALADSFAALHRAPGAAHTWHNPDLTGCTLFHRNDSGHPRVTIASAKRRRP
jgi:hypothetical protein